MRTVGIIAEYNPFHNGHKYHIEKAKELSGADTVIALMSGNYVQRGAPALFDKSIRADAALRHGADLILELPTLFSTGSAEIFAKGAVSLLDRIGVTDSLCFGTEGASVEELSAAAAIFLEEPAAYQETLRNSLKAGLSFPAAREQALLAVNPSAAFRSLSSPNHILGIEYLKALQNLHSRIVPYACPRTVADYHDTSYENRFYSASALRELQKKDSVAFLTALSEIDNRYKFLEDWLIPLDFQDFSLLLGEKLLCAKREHTLSAYSDITEDLAHTIANQTDAFTDVASFLARLKSKNYTYTRLSRSLVHLMLGITDDLVSSTLHAGCSYVRILGFTKKGQSLLGEISRHVTVLTKLSGWESQLSTQDKEIFKINLHGDQLYRLAAMQKSGRILPTEYERRVLSHL